MAAVSVLQESATGRPSVAAHIVISDHHDTTLPDLIGDAPAFRAMKQHIRRIACASAPVLIEGEAGCGKELAARAIHRLSARRHQPFVVVNCGGIAEPHIEPEWFESTGLALSHSSSTGADAVAQARGGTLYLDEVDALSPSAQASLLRFLQEQRNRALRSTGKNPFDVRIIAARSRSSRERMARSPLRSDMLYRLDMLSLQIPPLRERPGDLPMLARHFVDHYCKQYGLAPKRLGAATLRWMHAHDWPDNVSELENLVQRLVLIDDGDEIVYAGPASAKVPADDANTDGVEPDRYPSFQQAKAQAVASFERRYLAEVMARTRGNVSAAARLANKERRALGKLLRKHGIDRRMFQE